MGRFVVLLPSWAKQAGALPLAIGAQRSSWPRCSAAVRPDPSLERGLHRHGPCPARRRRSMLRLAGQAPFRRWPLSSNLVLRTSLPDASMLFAVLFTDNAGMGALRAGHLEAHYSTTSHSSKRSSRPLKPHASFSREFRGQRSSNAGRTNTLLDMFKHIESVVLFVPDVGAAAAWYAEVFQSEVGWENPRFAYIKAAGIVMGFHPADSKCPGGVGGTTAYWEVDSINEAVEYLTSLGARLHRGPGVTSFGAGAAMLMDPFGCTIGLNASSLESRSKGSTLNAPGGGSNSAA